LIARKNGLQLLLAYIAESQARNYTPMRNEANKAAFKRYIN